MKRNFKTKPFDHQREALSIAHGRAAFAYLMQQGTGKTWVGINEAALLWDAGKIDALEIYAPKGVHENWYTDEIPKHMPDWVKYEACCWDAGAKAKERKALERFITKPTSGYLRIFMLNWDAIVTKRGIEVIKRFRSTVNNIMMIADESQYIKTPGRKRSNAIIALGKNIDYKRIMTGTPIANAPFDLFSQFSFLDPRILRTPSFFAFKAQYAEMMTEESKLIKDIKRRTNKTPQIVATDKRGNPMYKNLDKLADLIAPHSYRKLKSECLDLPPKLYSKRYFDLTKEQREAYNLMRDECRAILADGTVKAVQKLSAIMKLAQLTSGYVMVGKDAQRIEGDNPKLQLLEEELERNISAGIKVIVWCRFHVEIDDVCSIARKNKWTFVEYHGNVKKSDRLEARKMFQNNEIDIFIGQQQAGGVGLTLTAAQTVIYYSNTFSLLDREQSEDRPHRIGQTNAVNYIDLIANDTIDGAIIDVLQRKQRLASIINRDDLI